MLAFSFFALILTGCKAQSGISPNTETDKNNKEIVVSKTETIDSKTENKAIKKMDTIKISGLQNKYTLKIGQKLLWVSQEHASVGKMTEYSIKGTKVIRFLNKESLALNENPELKGADKKQISRYFEAVQSGSCQVIFKEMFRGELKSERLIEITVE